MRYLLTTRIFYVRFLIAMVMPSASIIIFSLYESYTDFTFDYSKLPQQLVNYAETSTHLPATPLSSPSSKLPSKNLICEISASIAQRNNCPRTSAYQITADLTMSFVSSRCSLVDLTYVFVGLP